MSALLQLLLAAASTKKAAGIVRRSSSTNSGAVSSSSWTVNKPTGAAVGDVALVALCVNDTQAPGALTGFTQLAQVTCTADSAILTVWGRVIDGTEGSTFGGTLTSTGFNNWVANAILYEGVDTSSITDGVTTLVNNTPAASPFTETLPSITTTVNNDMQVAFFSIDPTAANAGNPSYTTPTGFTAIDTVISPRQVADLASFEKTAGAAGATGTVASTVTFPAASAGQLGVHVALRDLGPFALSGSLTSTGNTSLAYSSNMTLSGKFTGPVTMSTGSGTLPPGLSWSVSGNTATLAGTPTTASSYTFTPVATDNLGRVATGPSQTIVVSSGLVGIVQTKLNQKATGSTNTITPTTPFTAGNKVVVLINRFSGTSITGVTINGTAATKQTSVSNGTNNSVEIWMGTAGAGSAGCIVNSSSSSTKTVSFIERDDINSLDVTVVANTPSSGTSFGATTATTTQAKEWVVAGFVGQNNENVTITPPAGYTVAHNEPNGFSQAPGCCVYKQVAATGTQTATFTTASSLSGSGVCIATFKLN